MDSLKFFYSIPDDVLVNIALNDWESLEALCAGLSIDLNLLKEENNERT